MVPADQQSDARLEPGARIEVAPPIHPAVLVVELVLVLVLLVWVPSPLIGVMTVGAAVLLLIVQSLPAHLEIKSEALVWRWAGVDEVVPLRRLEHLDAREQVLELLLEGGGPERRFRVQSEPSQLDAFLLLLIRKRDAARGAPSEVLLPELARGDRDHRRWAVELQRLVRAEHFRLRGVGVDELLRVALDPAASLEARAAAIVAAYPHAAEEARGRIRFVAEQTAVAELERLVAEVEAEAEGEEPSPELCRALGALAPMPHLPRTKIL